jgi:hypothetical protein
MIEKNGEGCHGVHKANPCLLFMEFIQGYPLSAFAEETASKRPFVIFAL